MILLALLACAELDAGVEAFEAGQIPAAIDAWEEAVEGGWGSGVVKYNLGNAYYRRGDLPRAIAYWRAAADLRPRSSAISHNLALARGDLDGLPPPAAANALWMSILTPGELGLLGSLWVLLGSGGLVVRGRRREGSRLPWLGLGLLGWTLAVVAMLGWWTQRGRPLAVVVDQPAPLRLSPDLEVSPHHRLQPGAEVAVLDASGHFLLVETGNQTRGWVTDGAVFRVAR